jgi:voltage-gated potassium channel
MVTDIRTRLLFGVMILGGVYFVGMVGYMLFGPDGTTVIDALYMTTITLTTVGFGEVVPVMGNPGAQIFTIVLIIGGVGTLMYMLTTATAFVVEGELAQMLGRRRMDKQLAKMDDHYIVCGGGETAVHVIAELVSTGRGVVFIETDRGRVEKVTRDYPVPYVVGDATTDNALKSAGIERAVGIIFALPEDRDNILGVITARSLNPKIKICTKGVDVNITDKMIKAGADSVVSPSHIGAMRLVSQMVRPETVAFLDGMLRMKGKAIRLEEVVLGPQSTLIGETVTSSNIHQKTGFLVVGIREAGTRKYIPNPPQDRPFKDGDVLIVMGEANRLDDLRKFGGGLTPRQVTETTLTKMTDVR